MKVKIFGSRTRPDLEKQVNTWLETHPVSPDSMRFQYGAIYMDDPEQHIVEHTLVLFYVPMMPL